MPKLVKWEINYVSVLKIIFPLIFSVLSSSFPFENIFLKLHLFPLSSSFSLTPYRFDSITFNIQKIHLLVSCQTPCSLIIDVSSIFHYEPVSGNAYINWAQFRTESIISKSFCLSWTETVIKYLIISPNVLRMLCDFKDLGLVI